MADVAGLSCGRCGAVSRPAPGVFTCPGCHRDVDAPGILEVVYGEGYPERLPALMAAPGGLSGRFSRLLPLGSTPVSLGEGGTPLTRALRLEREMGMGARIHIKNESTNPTGSFKDRLATVVVTHARETGADTLVLVSSGNMAASVAAYSAVARMRCVAIVPPGAAPARLAQISAYGASPVVVRGTGSDRLALLEGATRGLGWYNATSPFNPYGPEGARPAAYEEFLALGRAPDWLVIPTGFGCNLTGHWRGYRDLMAAGLTGCLPRMVAVQPEGSPSLVRAFEEGLDEAVPGPQDTIAGGISQTVTPGSRACLRALRETGGTAIAVSDREIVSAARTLASSEGILAEPSGAAGVAGLARLMGTGLVEPGQVVVVVVTGHGLNDLSTFGNGSGVQAEAVDPDVDQLERAATRSLP